MEKNTVISAVVAGSVGVVVGGVLTYVTVNKRLRDRYEEQAAKEIAEVKRSYSLLRKEEGGDLTILKAAQNPSPEIQRAVEHGKHLIEQLGYSEASTEKPIEEDKSELDETQQTLSIFDQGIDPKTLEEDEPEEHDAYVVIDGEPFKITVEEYFENEPGYMLDTLTYYELDDTLTDEKNAQIDRVEETIGLRHLHMFPKQRDAERKTSIYIRNDEHETLYEVILVEDSYARLILGMDEVELGLKEPKQRPKKMRDGD